MSSIASAQQRTCQTTASGLLAMQHVPGCASVSLLLTHLAAATVVGGHRSVLPLCKPRPVLPVILWNACAENYIISKHAEQMAQTDQQGDNHLHECRWQGDMFRANQPQQENTCAPLTGTCQEPGWPSGRLAASGRAGVSTTAAKAAVRASAAKAVRPTTTPMPAASAHWGDVGMAFTRAEVIVAHRGHCCAHAAVCTSENVERQRLLLALPGHTLGFPASLCQVPAWAVAAAVLRLHGHGGLAKRVDGGLRNVIEFDSSICSKSPDGS